LKLGKSSIFWLIYSISLIVYSFNLFLQWGLMMVALFGLFWVFRLTRMETTLNPSQRRYYLWAIALYPAVQTVVLRVKMAGGFPADFDWVNRLEHTCWAIALLFFFLPLIAPIWRRLQTWQNLLFIASFVCLLGNLNEFLEYLFRLQPGPVNTARFAAFYSDTIYDMAMNLLGSAIGFGLLKLLFRRDLRIR
jgi:hypothetical protein